jgi:glycerophosphoryl diester phosphodiesterase
MHLTRRHVVLPAAIVLGLANLLSAVPAQAVPGGQLLGHRCRTYNPATNNEDTVAALVNTSKVPGAWCEVDAWTIADGTVIIWHDSTWGRVSDHSTLPPGVLPTDKVKDATWQQVSQIRTTGGSPVATLGSMIDASAAHGVPLVVEVRNSIDSPAHWVSYAGSQGAQVRYYSSPRAGCTMPAQLNALRTDGAIVGLKLGLSPCVITPTALQAMGASFVTVRTDKITKAYTDDLHAHGVDAYASGATAFTAATVLANGAAKLLVNRPRQAANW